MIIRAFFKARGDGVKLYRTYSDGGYRICQEQTGAVYDEAIDIEGADYTYTETADKIPVPPIAEDMSAPEEIGLAITEGVNGI